MNGPPPFVPAKAGTQGHGRSGHNRDYVLDTVKEIERQGYRDGALHLLAERLKGGSEKVG